MIGWDRRHRREDRRRTAILERDAVFDLDVGDLVAAGPVTSRTGGGRGPTLRPNEAERCFRSIVRPGDLIQSLSDAAERAGWTISHADGTDTWAHVQGSRTDHGFGEALGIHLKQDDGVTEVRVFVRAMASFASR